MDAFTPLRKLARENRDNAVARAHAEYKLTMSQIAAIEGRLIQKRPRPDYMNATICAALPRDTEFTGPDLLAVLEAADDGRIWTKKAVTNFIGKLRRRGLIRRMRRATANRPAVYVRIGADSDPADFKDVPLPEVIQAVLSEPMSVVEIAQAALEAGYRTTQSAAGLRQSIRVELRKGGFRKVGAKWAGEKVS